MLRLKELYKTYPGAVALAGIDMEIDSGATVAVLGASGCGKSTLLLVIAGFLTPDRGRVFLNRKDITGNRPEKRRVGTVFQETLLFPHLDVRENILFGIRQEKDREAKVNRLIDLFGLEGLEGRKSHELSGGQARRVAIARTLAVEPDLLLLDEPLSGLDSHLRPQIRDEIGSVLKELRQTTIIVTHDPDDAYSLAEKVCLMEEGRIIQSGGAEYVYRNPVTLEAARLMGPAFTLSDSMAKELGLKSKKAYRPDDISLGTLEAKKIHMEVRRREFLGGKEMLTLDISDAEGKINRILVFHGT